ncbi:hypothetical protein [Derxia gummosa]|uniref:Uncharacterized protein n=1 Tax=Derxia gummosa DSM 723 TaxID=1121388 RepID=A0A8B6X8V3_9BURK|nr:hypothetical protein [Derxia gummosa]
MAIFHLDHLILHDGSSRRAWLHEVQPELLQHLRHWLADALERGHSRIPWSRPICDIVVRDHGPDWLYATICNEEEIPIATLAIAGSGTIAARLWGVLHDSSKVELKSDPAALPPVPWLALRREPGVRYVPDTESWLPDFARCVAFAHLNRRPTVTDEADASA